MKTIELLGVPYSVLWDDEAMRIALHLLGNSAPPHPDKSSLRERVRHLGVLLYAALSAAAGTDPPLTLGEVHEQLTQCDADELCAAADTVVSLMVEYRLASATTVPEPVGNGVH